MENNDKIRKSKTMNTLNNVSELHRKICRKFTMKKQSSYPVNRCLFGRADPIYTKRLLKEEMKKNTQRFLKDYNFDIENVTFIDRTVEPDDENIENDLNQQNIPRNNYEDFRAPKKKPIINFTHSPPWKRQSHVKNFFKIKKQLFKDEKPQQQQENEIHPLGTQNPNQI